MKEWYSITPEEASMVLFHKCVGYMLNSTSYLISADPIVRAITQRLYGDYRQVHNTAEYKRAEKHVHQFKNTGLGKELF